MVQMGDLCMLFEQWRNTQWCPRQQVVLVVWNASDRSSRCARCAQPPLFLLLCPTYTCITSTAFCMPPRLWLCSVKERLCAVHKSSVLLCWRQQASGKSSCQMNEQCAGHSAPISQVCCDQGSQVALSSSYDKTVRVWSFAGRERAVLTGHTAPVLELRSNNAGCAISGDRSGNIMLWDVEAQTCLWAMKRVHKGHVTALAWADAAGGNDAWRGCFASGGQDGCARSCSGATISCSLHAVSIVGHSAHLPSWRKYGVTIRTPCTQGIRAAIIPASSDSSTKQLLNYGSHSHGTTKCCSTLQASQSLGSAVTCQSHKARASCQ